MQGGGGGPIPISQLVSQVQVDLGSSTQNLSEHKAQLQAADQSSRQMGAASAAMATDIAQADTSIKQATADLEKYRADLQLLQQIQQNAGKFSADLNAPIKEAQAEIKRLEDQLKSMGSTAQESTQKATQSFLGTVTSIDAMKQHLQELQAVQARGQAQGVFTPGLQQEIQRTESALKSVTESSESFGTSISRTTERMLLHVVAYAAIYAAIREVTNAWNSGVEAAIGFQSSLLKVDALTVGGAADTRAYSAELVKMSQHLPATAKELGDALFYIESHGIHGAAAMDLLNQAALGSEAGLGKTADIARIAAGAMEAYGEKNLTAARAVDILTAGVKEGSLAPESLANSLGKVVGIAAHMGITFEEVIANIATLTRQSVPAAQAVTDLSSVMTGLNRPSAQAQKALADMGMSAADLRNSIREQGLLATLAMLEEKTGGNADQIQALLPNVRALRDMYGVTGAQAAAYAQTLKDVQDSEGGTAQAADIMSKSVENQRKVLDNNWNALIIGLDLLPKVSAAMGGVSDYLQKMTEGYEKEKEAQIVDNALKGEFAAKSAELYKASERLISDADKLGMSYAVLNDQLRQMKVPAEFLAQMDYLAGRLGSFPDPFGKDYKPPPQYGPFETDRTALQQGGSTYDFEAQRRQAQQIADMGAHARSLHTAAEKLSSEESAGLPDPAKIEKDKQALLVAAAEVKTAWRAALSPEEFEQRASALDAQINKLAQSTVGATAEEIAELDRLTAAWGNTDAAAKKTAQDAAQQKRDDATRAREAREAREADPLLGIRQGLAKDREDLIGTAGTVMADISNAVALKGQQGARAAGEAFANEARRWGQELEKAGLPGWKEAFDHLIALGETAVVTGSEEVRQQIHDLLAGWEQEIKEAKIADAMAEAMARANLRMLEAQTRTDDQLMRAQVAAADSRAQALQGEADREYDIWANRQVDELVKADQNGRELQRIKEGWGREDADRELQQNRAKADRDEQAHRAEVDRAQNAARTLSDIQQNQNRSQADLGRARRREEADAEYEHQKRVTEITKAGGPNMSKALLDEQASYQQSIRDRTRSRGEDDAEAQIKQAQQVADAQRRIAEQAADAQRRAGEQGSDLAKRQGEQNDDLTRNRARQLQARVDQNADQIWLRDQRILHEQHFYVDAETRAHQKFQNDLSRIDARYQHEEERAAAASAQIQLTFLHDQDTAEIKARASRGAISEAEATRQLGVLDLAFTQQQGEINTNLRTRETAIDEALRDQIAKSRQYAPGFAGRAAQGAGGGQNPFQWAGGQVDSVLSTLRSGGVGSLFNLGGQQGQPGIPIPVFLPDRQIDDIAEAVAGIPPIELDGEVVEASGGRIRRNRNTARVLG